MSLPRTGARTTDAYFGDRHAALLAFMEKKGKRPSHKSTEPVERSVACWFIRQRQIRNKGVLSPDRAQMLAEAENVWVQLPGPVPRVLSQGDFSGYTRRLVSFYEKHGRLPGHTDPKETTDYQSLRIVWRCYRHGKLSQAELKALRRIPGALKVTRKEPLPRLAELQAWCAKHHRLPRHQFHRKTTPAEDVEAGLGQWMYRHVNRRHESLETAETTHIRDSIIALQDTYPASGKVTEEIRAAAVVEFIEKHGHMPRVRREHELYEHAFAIRAQYRHGGAFRPATLRMLELTRDLPNYLESQWDGDFDRVAEFVANTGRLPAAEKSGGRGRPTTEYQLTKWLERESGDGATVKDPARQAKLAAIIASVALPVAA